MLNQQAQTRSSTAKKTGLSFLLILSALMAVTSLSTDIYLQAMPIMAKDLQGDAELTITGFLIGFCIAQLIWGPISDRYGRRLPLLSGSGQSVQQGKTHSGRTAPANGKADSEQTETIRYCRAGIT